MVVSSLVNAARHPQPAAEYRALIAERPIVVSFATVTEIRYGALKAGWGELRRRGLERDLARFVVAQPDDRLMDARRGLRASCASEPGMAPGEKIHSQADRWGRGHGRCLLSTFELARVSDDLVFTDVPRSRWRSPRPCVMLGDGGIDTAFGEVWTSTMVGPGVARASATTGPSRSAVSTV
ncbi:MAG: hypothetical protein U5R31_08565 [Acidimicrobiia bacterium]|nr:hypothetical protein [Acidimicrobiia bacterium]